MFIRFFFGSLWSLLGWSIFAVIMMFGIGMPLVALGFKGDFVDSVCWTFGIVFAILGFISSRKRAWELMTGKAQYDVMKDGGVLTGVAAAFTWIISFFFCKKTGIKENPRLFSVTDAAVGGVVKGAVIGTIGAVASNVNDATVVDTTGTDATTYEPLTAPVTNVNDLSQADLAAIAGTNSTVIDNTKDFVDGQVGVTDNGIITNGTGMVIGEYDQVTNQHDTITMSDGTKADVYHENGKDIVLKEDGTKFTVENGVIRDSTGRTRTIA